MECVDMFAYKIVKEWVLPPKIYTFFSQTYLDFKIRISYGGKSTLSRNSVFKDKYKGKRCFIIGNGPSVNKQDLTPLKGEITIVMNDFYHHPILEKWQPTFYCIGDSARVYINHHVVHNPQAFENLKRTSKIIFPEGYFFTVDMKHLLEPEHIFPKEKTYYLDMRHDISYYHSLKTSDFDLTKQIPSVDNTALLAIILAIYAGCNKIYLLGLDHDWFVTSGYTRYFYGHDEKYEYELHEEHGRYKHLMESILHIFKNYAKLHEYALNNNIEIINATAGGYLDEFPRAKFEEIV